MEEVRRKLGRTQAEAEEAGRTSYVAKGFSVSISPRFQHPAKPRSIPSSPGRVKDSGI